jgi:hypothetical protein
MFICNFDQLSDFDQALASAYDTRRDILCISFILSIDSEVAATVLLHPAAAMDLRNSPDSSKRDFRGEQSRTRRRKQ